jgi:hypothetical protein
MRDLSGWELLGDALELIESGGKCCENVQPRSPAGFVCGDKSEYYPLAKGQRCAPACGEAELPILPESTSLAIISRKVVAAIYDFRSGQ